MLKDLKNMFDLRGKVAIITGAGSGIGKAIADGFAQFGAKVVAVDINEEAARNTVNEIRKAGYEGQAIKCNVAKSEEVKSAVDTVIKEYGQINILVNNAGLGRRSKAEEMSDEDWDTVLDINLKGAFCFCREAGKKMIEKARGGRIINVSSIAGVVGVETGNANYSASKGGMIAMSRCLAIEWAAHNILVNVIVPSHTRTPLIEKLMKDKPETEKYFLNNIPLGRLGEVEDLVGPAIFLASDASKFVTGHVLAADGGHTAK